MVGEDPDLRNSGAGSLLVWEAIQFAHLHLGLIHFGLLVSMIEPIETVRRSFGARQVPFHQVEKISLPWLRAIFAWKGNKLT